MAHYQGGSSIRRCVTFFVLIKNLWDRHFCVCFHCFLIRSLTDRKIGNFVSMGFLLETHRWSGSCIKSSVVSQSSYGPTLSLYLTLIALLVQLLTNEHLIKLTVFHSRLRSCCDAVPPFTTWPKWAGGTLVNFL